MCFCVILFKGVRVLRMSEQSGRLDHDLLLSFPPRLCFSYHHSATLQGLALFSEESSPRLSEQAHSPYWFTESPRRVLLGNSVDLHRFRGLFETENSARKGEHCHEQTRPTHQNFAEKLSGWLELPMRSILSLGSPVRLVSPTVPLGVGSTKMRSTAASEKG